MERGDLSAVDGGAWQGSRARPVRDDNEALTLLRLRYRSFFECNLDAVITVDPQGCITDCNPAAEKLSGYSADELIGMNYAALCAPEALEYTVAHFMATFAGVVGDHSTTMICKDGRRAHLYLNGSPVVRDGRIVELCVVARDVTAQLVAEEALRRSERLFKGTFENAAVGMAHVAVDGSFLRVNDKLCEITGYSRRELMARTFVAITHPDDVEADLEQACQLWSGDISSYSMDKRYITRSGGVVWVNLTATVQRDEAGRPEHHISVIKEINQRKQYEQALLETRIDLERRVDERTAELQLRAAQLSRLAAELTVAEQRERRRLGNLLHEHLQQLLVAARLHASVLQHGETDTARRQSIDLVCSIIGDAIKTCRSLTDEIDPPILRLGGLIAGLQWLGNLMREQHQLTVVLEADGESLSIPHETSLLLFHCVRKLLLNVIRHSGVSTARLTVRLLPQERISISVSDDGCGFDADAAPESREGGFGLFSIVQRLSLLGGRVDVVSRPGQGTSVTLIMPLSTDPRNLPAPAAARSGPAANPAAPQLPASAERPTRVLIVDDHAILRQGLTELLRREGDLLVVGEAADGLQAVEMAQQLRPDVILMDFGMPQLDGIEATRLIHNRFPEIRIIGLSMFDDSPRAAEMITAGAVAFLAKSGRNQTLLSIIRSVR